jgi:hypothetical protein
MPTFKFKSYEAGNENRWINVANNLLKQFNAEAP